ncbi:MAG: aspartate aminotransferase family protein [Actinobacteria bacterium]|nr:aspartate aminotransferase family protein [Actinomycetota bacterium]
MSRVFRRAVDPPVAVRAEGVWVEDADGRRYLDAAGGAVVVGIGHGDTVVAAALAEQAARLAYVHGSAFTTEALEAYAAELAEVAPVPGARVFPVSGGSEAVETALKLARAYHLARGETERSVVIARHLSYHGNTRGALAVSGRPRLRAPYEPWLGHAVHIPAVTEYRCPAPGHPRGCGAWHAAQLERAIEQAGPGKVAAFIAEPIGGATTGAAAPPDDYWPAVAAVCRRHGVLLIADEVMTGFGRTGKWFAADHWGLRPDLLVAAKGASSGYWPLGLCIASAEVHETVTAAGGFVHGLTFSHHPVGAAVGRAVLGRLHDLGLVEAAAVKEPILQAALSAALGDHPAVGDIRGRGLLAGVEFVADRETRLPFPPGERVVERVVAAARRHGLLVYWSKGCADGVTGDVVVLGPPLIITPEEIALIAERLGAAVAEVFAGGD